MSEEKLLDLRICDLKLTLKGTWLEEQLDLLHETLARRGLKFRPHAWLSEEWFTPDQVPGFAVPFYLAHPRLRRLERKMMLEVEGGSERTCQKLMRHEAGHAIQNAFRLHLRRTWQRVFGKASAPYPDFYRPRPVSKRFVQHLDLWYAQSHPTEDFAETFAVWLKPRQAWRKQYKGWRALKKLEYVDSLMGELAGETPPVRSRKRMDTLPTLRQRLRAWYGSRVEHLRKEFPDIYDRDLKRLFSDDPKHRRRERASKFLRRNRKAIREMVAEWTGEYQVTIDAVFEDVIGRSRELKLRVEGSERETRLSFAIFLTARTMQYLYTSREAHPL